MNKQEYKHQLLKIINNRRRELQIRKTRLEYNILSGVSKISIESQRKTIQNIKIILDNLEYIYQHDNLENIYQYDTQFNEFNTYLNE